MKIKDMDVETFSQQTGGFIQDPAAAPMEEEIDAILDTSKRVDDHSSAIADKLLQGWTLMNEHCPQCYTPLVRNRQRKLYCVACRQWVLTEAEAEALQQRSEKVEVSQEAYDSQPNQSCADVGPHASLPLPGRGNLSSRTNAVNHSRVASLRGEDQDASEERHAKRLAADTAILSSSRVASSKPIQGGAGELLGCYSAIKVHDDGSDEQVNLLANTSTNSSLVLPKVELPLNMEAVLLTTLATVVQKVEETRRLIASTQNTNELTQLLDILLKSLEVVKNLKSLGIQ
ncbi:hypothetical protein O6H91_12G047700 [Diphasiastrum complanatum]|uniref:Uncharacterized protein n=1 Tax=Diphasiastrum complanatum TaxID=34168 RepID=A0ACC2C1Z0_DIPCM|nr:hypothetical protein O6H91_12G047700 [Diphasiastrum complanatum]